MSDRLISADALLREAMKDGAYGYVDAWQIKNAPTVDAEPVRHGHWEDSSNGWMCSECFREMHRDYQYCPFCGAKMDEVEE